MTTPPTNRRPAVRALKRPQKTALLIAQRVIGQIADDELPPGAALPPEREMLESFGVSRATLREALRFLEMQDVVTLKSGPGGGPIVSQHSPRAMASTVALMSQLRRMSFRDVLQARIVLEPCLTRLTAEHVTDDEIDEIDASVEAIGDVVGDVESFLEENARFHLLIAEAARVPMLSDYLSSLQWIIDGSDLGAGYTDEVRGVVVEAHRQIAVHLRARDPERAADAMLTHVQAFDTFLESGNAAAYSRSVRWDQLRW